MKPLHKIINLKVPSRALVYIKVSAGYVYASDGRSIVKIPTAEIFGESHEIKENEELYFHATEWKTAKMDKAISIKRDGLMFESLDRKGVALGRAKALTELPDGLHYPEDSVLNDVIPEGGGPVATVGLPSTGLQAISEIFRTDLLSLEITAWDSAKALRVIPINADDSKAVGGIMPLSKHLPQYFECASDSAEHPEAPSSSSDSVDLEDVVERLKMELSTTADELQDAKEYISELESTNKDLKIEVDSLKEKVEELDEENDELILKEPTESMTATGHLLRYSTENLVDAQIMELFAECLANIKPTDMLENLRLMKEYKILI